MKLTIIRLENFSDQDRIDLQKIWYRSIPLPLYRLTITTVSTPRVLTSAFSRYVRVTLSGTEGALDSLRVREVTRRRGVGQYLLEEVLRNNPGVSCWWMADAGVEDRGVMTAFMQALGFTAQQGGWEKR
ncbi:aspartate 1-decarboxylase autocleavage activator PanM [Escherichia coli]